MASDNKPPAWKKLYEQYVQPHINNFVEKKAFELPGVYILSVNYLSKKLKKSEPIAGIAGPLKDEKAIYDAEFPGIDMAKRLEMANAQGQCIIAWRLHTKDTTHNGMTFADIADSQSALQNPALINTHKLGQGNRVIGLAEHDKLKPGKYKFEGTITNNPEDTDWTFTTVNDAWIKEFVTNLPADVDKSELPTTYSANTVYIYYAMAVETTTRMGLASYITK